MTLAVIGRPFRLPHHAREGDAREVLSHVYKAIYKGEIARIPVPENELLFIYDSRQRAAGSCLDECSVRVTLLTASRRILS